MRSASRVRSGRQLGWVTCQLSSLVFVMAQPMPESTFSSKAGLSSTPSRALARAGRNSICTGTKGLGSARV